MKNFKVLSVFLVLLLAGTNVYSQDLVKLVLKNRTRAVGVSVDRQKEVKGATKIGVFWELRENPSTSIFGFSSFTSFEINIKYASIFPPEELKSLHLITVGGSWGYHIPISNTPINIFAKLGMFSAFLKGSANEKVVNYDEVSETGFSVGGNGKLGVEYSFSKKIIVKAVYEKEYSTIPYQTAPPHSSFGIAVGFIY